MKKSHIYLLKDIFEHSLQSLAKVLNVFADVHESYVVVSSNVSLASWDVFKFLLSASNVFRAPTVNVLFFAVIKTFDNQVEHLLFMLICLQFIFKTGITYSMFLCSSLLN